MGKIYRFQLLVRLLAGWAARQVLVGRNRRQQDLKYGRFARPEVDA